MSSSRNSIFLEDIDRTMSQHGHQNNVETSSTDSGSNEISMEKPKPNSAVEYPPAHTVYLVMSGIFLTSFLVALDRTILGTAIPRITNEFDSLSDVGWYGSAYLLTSCSFQLLLGRVYTFYNPKTVFLCLLCVFEIGSALCGAAPNSPVLIVGRAIAGMGSAGIFSGAIVIIVRILPMEKRPMWTGFFGMVFGIANIIGPLLGGALTDNIGWRWCFYINLPAGAVAAVVLVFVLRIPDSVSSKPATLKGQFLALDPVGTALFLPAIALLLLALQLGGTSYPWTSAHVLPLLIISPLLLLGFIAVQYFNKAHATVPSSVIRHRSILAGTFFSFTLGSTLTILVYLLPIYFQAIMNASAVRSGILNIPLVIGNVTASVSAGFLTRKTGHYVPWMYFSAILMPLGTGLLTTIHPGSKHVSYVSFQVLVGLGIGFGMQQPAVAAQCVLEPKDVPTGAALTFFAQSLGGALSLSVANNIMDNKLVSGLTSLELGGLNIDAQRIVMDGATDFRSFTEQSALPAVLNVYNLAIRHGMYVALGTACASCIGAGFMQWKSIKTAAAKEAIVGE